MIFKNNKSLISLNNADIVMKELKKQGEFYSLTKGISMRPLFRQGKDIVVIQRVLQPLKKGDVPLYMRDNYDSLVLHRILKVRQNDYLIRGDNTYTLEYVPKSYVVGVLKAFYRNGKYYDCATNRKYKLYVFIIRISFPARFLWKKYIRPVLSKIKHTIIHC